MINDLGQHSSAFAFGSTFVKAWFKISIAKQILLAAFTCTLCQQLMATEAIEEPPNTVAPAKELTTLETYVYQARLADGETALRLELDARPNDDNVRFSLGVLQFFRAVENTGQALFEYGLLSDRLSDPILRLKVPQNNNPSELSHEEFGRVLDALRNDLLLAEKTLAGIQDDQVKIPIKLAKVALRISNDEDGTFNLTRWMQDIRIDVSTFLAKNPELEIHFDRGDVAWLRAYCHALCALMELYRSIDEDVGFEERFQGIFPRLKPGSPEPNEPWLFMLKIKDTSRLRNVREHLIAVCDLNKETWMHIRRESDDNFEWLSHPNQTDQLGIPVTNQQIDAWLGMMDQIGGLLKGERLISGELIRILNPNHPKSDGVNFKKVLNDPPKDLFNIARIQAEGIDPKYLEKDSTKPAFDTAAIFAVIQLFDRPFGFAQAARMN